MPGLKAADQSSQYAGAHESNLERIRDLAAIDPAPFASIDMMDPEAMLAFFETKIREAKGGLNAMVQEQEIINKRVTALQRLEALSNVSANINHPDPAYSEYVKTLKDAIAAAGGPTTETGAKLQALYDKGTRLVDRPGGPVTGMENAEKTKKDLEAQGKANVEIVHVQGDQYVVNYKDPYGFHFEEGKDPSVKTVAMHAKVGREALQADSQIRMIKVQQYVEQCSQLVNLASNIMRKINDMAMAAIQNIKG